MWLSRTTKYLLQHRWQALAMTFLLGFLPLFGVLSIVIAGFFTLQVGILQGALFTLAATLPYFSSFLPLPLLTAGLLVVAVGFVTFSFGMRRGAISAVMALMLFYFISSHPDLFIEKSVQPVGLLWTALGIASLSNLLTWVFAVMSRKGADLCLILQVATLLGVLVISVIHLIDPAVADWWAIQLQPYFDQASPMMGQVMKGHTLSETHTEMINASKQYATGFLAVAVLINSLLQLIAAMWWQAKVFAPGKLSKVLHHIRLSQLAGALFVLSLVLSYLGNTAVLDMMPVVYVLFCAAGLSLVHYFFEATKSTGWFWLVLFYVVLIWSFPISFFLMAMLALLDASFDLRAKFGKMTK